MGILCLECNKEFETLEAVRKHRAMSHKIGSEDTYIQYVLKGVVPKCECGCGGDTPFVSFGKGFSRFIRSHHNRVPGKNNFHKNPESKLKSAKTQSENWSKGLYRRWWEEDGAGVVIDGIKEKLRNNAERGDKISKALIGRKHSEEHRNNNSTAAKLRYVNNPELLEAARSRRIKWLQSEQSKKTTRVELLLMELFDSIGMQYEHQYEFKKRVFDFYLPGHNTLIEADGDFYHANPEKHEVKYKVQEITIRNDEYKNRLCGENGIQLIRYWESDIKGRPDWVVEDLQQKLGIY